MVALKELAEKISQQLKQQGLKIATAESCTGGGVSYWITSIPGSSAWFERGFVTYSNAAKIEMLGVKAETIARFGAVSEETAREMAAGALQHSEADVSVAITGIAGPDGGSEQKPVGTVWIAWTRRDGETRAEVAVFAGDRDTIRNQAIEKALMCHPALYAAWLDK